MKKKLSFDKNLKGDFELKDNIISTKNKEFIFIGCQILKKKLFHEYSINNFPISKFGIVEKEKKLNGFESKNFII